MAQKWPGTIKQKNFAKKYVCREKKNGPTFHDVLVG